MRTSHGFSKDRGTPVQITERRRLRPARQQRRHALVLTVREPDVSPVRGVPSPYEGPWTIRAS